MNKLDEMRGGSPWLEIIGVSPEIDDSILLEIERRAIFEICKAWGIPK